ncbi:hypothetical protein [Piscibacillus salipiscarius]|uniref:hypothetical protein n=1 Tax=Piscibacillus salipiscarius TaxID=299480 RepID=UPI0006D1586B|nr:hypothetical protein [Piscibacillus salipiscarius]
MGDIEFVTELNSKIKSLMGISDKLENEVINTSIEVSDILNVVFEHLTEVEIYFAFDMKNQLKINDINLNRLNINSNELQIAKR